MSIFLPKTKFYLLGLLLLSLGIGSSTGTAFGENTNLNDNVNDHDYDNVDVDVNVLANRDLQSNNRIWDISPPDISYRGMQLDLDYLVRDQVRTSYVSIQLYRDEDCEREITDNENNYITTDLINDLSAFGDGSETRTMTVNFNIDPLTVGQSRIISFTDVQAIVSFCVKFSMQDPVTGQTTNSINTPVAIGVDLTDNIGITGILQDEEENFGAEAYECDANNNAVDTSPLKSQGDSVRICVRPDAFTRGFGVVMKSINSFTLVRGDVSQAVLVPNSVIKNFDTTSYLCVAGNEICSIEAIVSNNFYYSRGEAAGSGMAWLQYSFGSSRKLIQVPIGGNGGQRKAAAAGGFIGARPFAVSFEVAPSAAQYNAIAFECNSRNLPLTQEEKEVKKVRGDSIRVCVTPNKAARDRGVFLRTIASFFFEQGENVQFSVEPTGKQSEDDKTLMICNPGESICAFKTGIADFFFESNDPVVGSGEVYLQFGSEPPEQQNSVRRTNIVWHDRATQVTDAGFAGLAEVFVTFTVDPAVTDPGEVTWQQQADDWWQETPLFLRIVYIMAIILAFLILLCFLWAICCGNPFRYKDTHEPEKKANDPKIIIQPIYVAPPPRADDDDEVNFCDCLANPEEFHFEPEEPPLQAPAASRSMPMDDVKVGGNGTSTPPQSHKKIEPQYSKSPKSRKSSTTSAMDDSSKSPRRQNPTTPLPRRGSTGVPDNDSGSVRSPRSRRASTGAAGKNSPSSRSIRMGKKKASSVSSNISSKSPKKPRSGRSSVSSPHSARRSTRKSPAGGDGIKSPGGRRASLETSRHGKTPKKSPRTSRDSVNGSRLPDAPSL